MSNPPLPSPPRLATLSGKKTLPSIPVSAITKSVPTPPLLPAPLFAWSHILEQNSAEHSRHGDDESSARSRVRTRGVGSGEFERG